MCFGIGIEASGTPPDVIGSHGARDSWAGVGMGRKSSTGIPGLSFSWKRELRISAAKDRLSRAIGIPLTRSGRQKMLGATAGCCVLLAVPVAGAINCVVAKVDGMGSNPLSAMIKIVASN
jgi:hypothetical protein